MKKISRRSFIQTSAALTAAVSFPVSSLVPKEKPIGIQLYSVREDMLENPDKTLKALARAGYNFVESFSNPKEKMGYANGKIWGLTIPEFKKMMKEYELKMPSSHTSFSSKDYDTKTKDITDEWKKYVEDALRLGQRYIISASWDDADRKTPEAAKKFCDLLNTVGLYCQNQNIRFGYHNHTFEFEKLGDELLYETLLKNTDPTLVAQEMDWGWAVAAKQDPVEWFKKYPGRFELAHVKDVDNDDNKKSTIIGLGKVDFPNILDNIKKGGVKYLIVEIEDYEKSPIEDAKVCYKNFHKLVRELN